MAFWGDFIKLVRSSVFKNELKNGDFQVKSLSNARTIRTNLGSTSAASFDGTKNVTPGITGTLLVTHGGTGATTPEGARTNLGLKTKKLTISISSTETYRAVIVGSGIKASWCVATISGVSASSDNVESDYSAIISSEYVSNPFTVSVVHNVSGETRIYITRPNKGKSYVVQVDVMYI
jgi:hypothetical protein